eukprot:Nitzschia sp. Nitz4//scaffold91_size79674//36399//37814//NITZ4_005368-RA/size79674-snap-gene-0.119-mRNA-1//1//CDS//3329560103//5906//frame0
MKEGGEPIIWLLDDRDALLQSFPLEAKLPRNQKPIAKTNTTLVLHVDDRRPGEHHWREVALAHIVGASNPNSPVSHIRLPSQILDDASCRQALNDLIHSAAHRSWGVTLDVLNELEQLGHTQSYAQADCFGPLKTIQKFQLMVYSETDRLHYVDSLFQSIPQFQNLQELRIERFGFREDSLSLLTNLFQRDGRSQTPPITLLSLRLCRFQQVGQSSLLELLNLALGQLQTLDVSYCSLDDTTIVPLLHQIRRNEMLECLDISGNRCSTPESVLACARLIDSDPPLGPNYSCTRLSEFHMNLIWPGKYWRNLSLIPLLEAIGRAVPSLRHLELSRNQLYPQDVEELVKSIRTSSLRHVDLRTNKFGSCGIQQLLKLMKEHPSLESVLYQEETAYRIRAIQSSKLMQAWKDRLATVEDSQSLWPLILHRLGTPASSLDPHGQFLLDISGLHPQMLRT